MSKKLFREQNLICPAIIIAVILIFCTFMDFRTRVDREVKNDMKNQIEAIEENCINQINNEIDYLKQLAETAVIFMSDDDYNSSDQITQTLQSYAHNGHVDEAFYLTPDGRLFSSYAGELTPDSAETSWDYHSLQGITSTTFTKSWYSDKLKQVLFGIAVPADFGRQKGVLISAYHTERFYTLFQNEFLGGSAEIALLSDDGTTVLGRQTEDHKNQLGLNVIDSLIESNIIFSNNSAEGMREDFQKGTDGFSSYYVQDTERYCSYAPIRYNHWYVIVMARVSVLRTQSIQLEHIGYLLALKLILIMTVLLIIIIVLRFREQKRVRSTLEKLAKLDGLTGILNRGCAETEIIHTLEHGSRNKKHALFLIDIDCFKNINDQYGHVVGDIVLKELARRLESCFFKTDIIGRMGGDEFIILMKDFTDPKTVREKALQLTAPLCCDTAEGTVSFSISVGISLYPYDGKQFMELYQHADEALYCTKRAGRNNYTFYSRMPVPPDTDCAP